MVTRRPLVRTARAVCPDCHTRLVVQIPPLVYRDWLADRPESWVAWRLSCVCSRELEVTVGDARRSA